MNGIWRDNDQFIDDVLIYAPGDFTARVWPTPARTTLVGTSDDPGTTITTYRQASDPADNRS